MGLAFSLVAVANLVGNPIAGELLGKSKSTHDNGSLTWWKALALSGVSFLLVHYLRVVAVECLTPGLLVCRPTIHVHISLFLQKGIETQLEWHPCIVYYTHTTTCMTCVDTCAFWLVPNATQMKASFTRYGKYSLIP